MPSASAPSVPGFGCTCQSANAVVRVGRGSIAMMVAPFSRASLTNGIACTPVLTRLVAHRMTTFISGRRSISASCALPLVYWPAAPPTVEQMVRSSRAAPIWWKKRSPMPLKPMKPNVPE